MGSTGSQTYLRIPADRLCPETWDGGPAPNFLLPSPNHCLHFTPQQQLYFPHQLDIVNQPRHSFKGWLSWFLQPEVKLPALAYLPYCRSSACLSPKPELIIPAIPFSPALLAHVQPHIPLTVRKRQTFYTYEKLSPGNSNCDPCHSCRIFRFRPIFYFSVSITTLLKSSRTL